MDIEKIEELLAKFTASGDTERANACRRALAGPGEHREYVKTLVAPPDYGASRSLKNMAKFVWRALVMVEDELTDAYYEGIVSEKELDELRSLAVRLAPELIKPMEEYSQEVLGDPNCTRSSRTAPVYDLLVDDDPNDPPKPLAFYVDKAR